MKTKFRILVGFTMHWVGVYLIGGQIYTGVLLVALGAYGIFWEEDDDE